MKDCCVLFLRKGGPRNNGYGGGRSQGNGFGGGNRDRDDEDWFAKRAAMGSDSVAGSASKGKGKK